MFFPGVTLLLGLVSVAWALEGEQQDVEPVRFDPVVRDVEGWTVHVEPALIDGKHAEEGARALAMLANHLQRIKILVPAEALVKLQTFEFWLEHDHPRIGGMSYHPSRQWLLAHDHDPKLTHKIHIARAAQLFSRDQMLKHPAVILHELAHAYHHQVLGFDDAEIRAAYEQAKQSSCYEEVLLYTGKTVRHYALSNHKEYFAEGTEAYFYRNDFYPFVRAELKEFDPVLHELLKNIWGPAE
ncbi:MAG: metallopeptidase [Planctomycetota bacterium]